MIPKIKLILVDDSTLFRQCLVKLLSTPDNEIIAQATNGKELIQLLKTKQPDVILLDLEMPVINGSKTLNLLRVEKPTVKVIILSRYHDENVIKDLFNRGANAFVSKNEAVEILLEAIRRVHTYGLYRDNLPFLLQNPAMKDKHYYKLLFTTAELRLIGHLLNASKQYKQIADELCLSEKTIENQAREIYTKVSVRSRTEFVDYGIRNGLDYLESPLK